MKPTPFFLCSGINLVASALSPKAEPLTGLRPGPATPRWRWYQTSYAFLLGVMLALPQVALAAPIAWGMAYDDTADTDVLVNGSQVFAYDWVGGSHTPGLSQYVGAAQVPFVGTNSYNSNGSTGPIVIAPTPASGVTLTLNGPNGQSGFTISKNTGYYTNNPNTLPPFSNLPTDYQNILTGGLSTTGTVPVTAKLSNLTVGHLYAVQVWISDPRTNGAYNLSEVLTSPGGNSVVMYANSTTSGGGVGQFAIGTFLADATATQTFTLAGVPYTMLNAIQVRDITNAWPAGSPITWGTPTTISGDSSDVNTEGTGVCAYDWAAQGGTVTGNNGIPVNFTQCSSNISAGSAATFSGFTIVNSTAFASGSAPFAGLTSAAYQSILKGGVYVNGTAPVTVTLNNLTVAHDYFVQLWVNDPRGTQTATRIETVTNTGGNPVTLEFDSTQKPGGTGQFVIGAFTASGPSQTFTLTGSASAQLNAFQLRDVTATPPAAQWINVGADGKLAYYSDDKGNRIPDFSYAGYEGGGVAIPTDSPYVDPVSPIGAGADDTSNIQTAINTVSAQTPDASGIRGVVQLGSGTFTIAGSLTISTCGVILSGVGDNSHTGPVTVLQVTGRMLNGTTARNVIDINPLPAPGKPYQPAAGASTYTITDSYVPLNATTFTLNSAPTFAANDQIVIRLPWLQSWVDAMGMNGIWNALSPTYPNQFTSIERTVKAINGNQVTVDVPLPTPIDSQWTTTQGTPAQVFKTNTPRVEQVGLENFCMVGGSGITDFPQDYMSGCAVEFDHAKDCWAQNLLFNGWGNAITLDHAAERCTVQDCGYIYPADTVGNSALPAAFAINGGQCLVQRCNAVNGSFYWLAVTGSGAPGPNVFLNLTGTGTHYGMAPHQNWAVGVLMDNISLSPDTTNPSYLPNISIMNRGGSQGWGAGFSVIYNSYAPMIELEQPTAANIPGSTISHQYNWAIGGSAYPWHLTDDGIFDAVEFGDDPNYSVQPQSLYLEQLEERLGPQALTNIAPSGD